MMSACSIVISAQSEAPRSPDRHLVDHDGSGRDGLRLWSRRISLRNLEENPVAGESGPTPPQFHRRAGPPIPCDRHVSIRTGEDEDVGAAGGVAATPQNDGAPQEGATPKPGAVRGTQWAALGTLAFRAGPPAPHDRAAPAPAYQGGVGVRVTPRRSKRQLREILTRLAKDIAWD